MKQIGTILFIVGTLFVVLLIAQIRSFQTSANKVRTDTLYIIKCDTIFIEKCIQ